MEGVQTLCSAMAMSKPLRMQRSFLTGVTRRCAVGTRTTSRIAESRDAGHKAKSKQKSFSNSNLDTTRAFLSLARNSVRLLILRFFSNKIRKNLSFRHHVFALGFWKRLPVVIKAI